MFVLEQYENHNGHHFPVEITEISVEITEISVEITEISVGIHRNFVFEFEFSFRSELAKFRFRQLAGFGKKTKR